MVNNDTYSFELAKSMPEFNLSVKTEVGCVYATLLSRAIDAQGAYIEMTAHTEMKDSNFITLMSELHEAIAIAKMLQLDKALKMKLDEKEHLSNFENKEFAKESEKEESIYYLLNYIYFNATADSKIKKLKIELYFNQVVNLIRQQTAICC